MTGCGCAGWGGGVLLAIVGGGTLVGGWFISSGGFGGESLVGELIGYGAVDVYPLRRRACFSFAFALWIVEGVVIVVGGPAAIVF